MQEAQLAAGAAERTLPGREGLPGRRLGGNVAELAPRGPRARRMAREPAMHKPSNTIRPGEGKSIATQKSSCC